MTPVSHRIKITKLKVFHLTKSNFGNGTSDFPCDESFTTPRTFVVKKDTITGKHVVSFAIIGDNPVSVQFCNTLIKASNQFMFTANRKDKKYTNRKEIWDRMESFHSVESLELYHTVQMLKLGKI